MCGTGWKGREVRRRRRALGQDGIDMPPKTPSAPCASASLPSAPLNVQRGTISQASALQVSPSIPSIPSYLSPSLPRYPSPHRHFAIPPLGIAIPRYRHPTLPPAAYSNLHPPPPRRSVGATPSIPARAPRLATYLGATGGALQCTARLDFP